MATAEIIELCEAVVADLKAASLCLPLIVKRVYVLPVKKEAERNKVEVYVTPRQPTRTRTSRSQWQRDLTIDVAMMANLKDDNSEAPDKRADKLMLLAEQIGAFYESNKVSTDRWFLVSVEHVPLWDREMFDSFNHFSSAIALTFRGFS